MGQTITEKIIAKHAGVASVKPDDTVTAIPDLVVMSERTGFTSMKTLEQIGVSKLHDPKKVLVVLDHTTQGTGTTAPVVWGNRQLRQWASAQQVGHFYDAGKGGLRHQVTVENGHAGPGMLCVTDEPNLDNMGALGALDYCVGKDVWQTMATGEIEVTVPRSLKFILRGTLRDGVTAWDIGQAVRHNQGGFGGVGKFIDFKVIRKIAEFDGPGVASLGIDGRMDLLAMYPVGMGIMNPDDVALEWARAHGSDPSGALRSDSDAQYEATFDYDLDTLEPKVSPPPSVRNAIDIGEVDEIRIDQAVVGSCDNGRMDDLRAVARILRGRKLAPSVRMFVSPISQKVYQQAAREGLLETFSEAGAIVETPGCGTCWGYVGQLAEGEVCVSTTQHNYPGRMGSSKASIFLASPFTVAASALAGRIVDPRKYL